MKYRVWAKGSLKLSGADQAKRRKRAIATPEIAVPSHG